MKGRDGPGSRVLDRERAVAAHGPGRAHTLVFTNGCFDLLHRGHAALLARAAGMGDRLLVGINSDASVRRLKGEGRPVLAAEDRAFLLASMRAVDAVTVFGEDTPESLIRALVPDVLVKGGDYAPEEVVGRECVERAGGRVELVPLEPGHSTTELVRRIRRGVGPGREASGGDAG